MRKVHPMIVGVTSLGAKVERPQKIVDKPVRTAVEIRLDRSNGWKKVLEDPSVLVDEINWFSQDDAEVAPAPLTIATCRRDQDGGRFDGTEKERLEVLRLCGTICDYVDVETGVRADVPAKKTIRSFHDFEGIPDDLPKLAQNLESEGAALLKIVGMAGGLFDNLRVRDFLKDRTNVACFLMGEYGLPSRILALSWGSRLTYASLGGGEIAPGMVDFQRLANLYRAADIDDEFELFGITGEHVSHSLSPAIHNSVLNRIGRKAVYLPLAARNVDDWLDFAAKAPVTGASVTIPFKEQLAKHCKKLDEASEKTGAVNTMLWLPEGGWRGRNVDWAGLLDDVKVEYAKPLFGRTALILGAGGTARSAVFGLREESTRVRVWGRNVEKAQALCEEVGGKPLEDVSTISGRVDILINATPCGMQGEYADEIAVQWDKLKPLLAHDALVIDVVYEPDQTPLLEAAEADGFKAVNGLGMLRRQASLQGQIFGYPLPHNLPEPERMKEHIWLVGYRAAGKSTLARELAIKLRRRAVDTDSHIALKSTRKIKEIFEQYGEADFRKREQEAIAKLAANPSGTVIAVGGGAVELDENVEVMRGSGMVIYLDADAELLRKRLSDDDGERPSLTGKSVSEEVEEVLSRRQPLYERAAHVRVPVVEKSAREFAGEIAEMLAEFLA